MWRRVLPLLLLLALGLAGGAVAGDFTQLEKATAKETAKIADVWMDLADWLADHGHKTPAEVALGEARALDVELDEGDVQKLTARIAAIETEAPVDATAERQLEKARGKVAKGYDKLSKIWEDEPQDPRFADFMLRALALDPSKRRLAAVADVAKSDLLLMHSPTHPFAAYVSLPKDWKPGKEWPVLVVVEGAGANHKGNTEAFKNARGSRDWIVVGAHALSCTNEIMFDKYPAYSKELIHEYNNDRIAFDVPGLLALLDYLHEVFGAEQKVAITGFSGGGNLCYGFTLRHPERVLCAAPACANYNRSLEQGAATAEGGGPPIRIMTGENDPHRYLTHGKTPPGIEEQTDWAEAALKAQGFEHVERKMLPAKHDPLRREVWEFVDEVRGRE